MTRRDVAVLSLRILALYVWFETLLVLWNVTYFLADLRSQAIGSEALLGMLLSMLLLAGFGAALHLAAPAIAQRIFPGGEPMSSASRPEIGTLALKICGLLVLANCLKDLGRSLTYLKYSKTESFWGWADAHLLMIPLMAIVGAGLILGAGRLSKRLFGTAARPMEPALLAHIQAVAFAVVGVYLVAISLIPIAQYMVERVYVGDVAVPRPIWTQIAVVLLGVWLIVGANGLARFWHWMRHAGLDAPKRVT